MGAVRGCKKKSLERRIVNRTWVDFLACILHINDLPDFSWLQLSPARYACLGRYLARQLGKKGTCSQVFTSR